MSETFDCTTEEGRTAGLDAAVGAVRDREVVVLPTDTVYGVGADAFSPDAVRAVLDAKGRGADMPPPVLIPHARTADGLATAVPAYARDLMDAFWPGPLTLVLLAQPTLMWDLGDTNGTVALRVPQDDVALELLAQTGPMAVTSANLTGRPAALTAREALLMLGDAVSVYLDNGPSTGGEASTILDCTQAQPRILRQGALSADELQAVLGDVRLEGHELPEDEDDVLAEHGVHGAAALGGGLGLAAAASVAADDEQLDDGDLPVVAATQDAAEGYVPRHRSPDTDDPGVPGPDGLDGVEPHVAGTEPGVEVPDGVVTDAPGDPYAIELSAADLTEHIDEDPERDAPGAAHDPNL